MPRKATAKETTERAEATEFLRKHIAAGSTVWTNLCHVSKSGMFRKISVHIVDENRRIWNVSGYAAKALGWKLDTKDLAIKIDGCGEDKGFVIVYALSRTLFPNGCPDRPDRDGGYALRHEWI